MVGVHDRDREQLLSYGEIVKGSGTLPTTSTVFEIGSVTKTFTAALFALFVQRGLVRFDDPLQQYVPVWVTVPSYNGQPITLIDLATHTSGLPKSPPLRGIQHLTDEMMYRYLNDYHLTRPPGTQYEYSNTGFALLAHALTRVAGVAYEPLIEREISAKLGMADTRITLTRDEERRFAQGYNARGWPAPVNLRSWPAFIGAGALRSTPNDMMRYLRFNLGILQTDLNGLLPLLQKKWHMAMRPGTGVGLAWQMAPLQPGSDRTMLAKNGGTAGFHSHIACVKETQTGVVMLANTAVKGSVDRAAVRILRVLNHGSERNESIDEPPDDSEEPGM